MSNNKHPKSLAQLSIKEISQQPGTDTFLLLNDIVDNKIIDLPIETQNYAKNELKDRNTRLISEIDILNRKTSNNIEHMQLFKDGAITELYVSNDIKIIRDKRSDSISLVVVNKEDNETLSASTTYAHRINGVKKANIAIGLKIISEYIKSNPEINRRVNPKTLNNIESLLTKEDNKDIKALKSELEINRGNFIGNAIMMGIHTHIDRITRINQR